MDTKWLNENKMKCRKFVKIRFKFKVKIHYIRRPQILEKYNSHQKLWTKEEGNEKKSTVMTPSY